jgi:electron transport complex protein RnfG
VSGDAAPGHPPPAAVPPAWPMYRALVGIGMLSGLLIALVYNVTLPLIERNRAEALERAVFAVLAGAVQRRTFVLGADGRLVGTGTGAAGDADGPGRERVHAAFGADGELIGIAIEASGMGYADTIELLYGYAPAREAIVGIRVLASRETPGLGDRIETDAAFLENFVALQASLDTTGTQLAHSIRTVKHGQKSAPWEIDGITGATISSVAVGDMLAASSARWVPLLAAQLDALVPAAGDDPATTLEETDR